MFSSYKYISDLNTLLTDERKTSLHVLFTESILLFTGDMVRDINIKCSKNKEINQAKSHTHTSI